MQPTADAKGTLKYDMRIIANNVEYFSFVRDQRLLDDEAPLSPGPEDPGDAQTQVAPGLSDSLWYFDGGKMHCWPDILDLLKAAAVEGDKALPTPIDISIDFYPMSVAYDKAIVVGLEPEIIQRRDLDFAYWRSALRVTLCVARLSSGLLI